MKLICSLLPCLLIVCGCQTAPCPSVSLVNVRFSQATAFETTATFTLRLSNESPQPLQLDGGVHKIYLNGLCVGEGLNSDTLELPRLGTATQDVTVHLSNLRMVTRIKPIIESRSFVYRIKSVVYGNSTAGRMKRTSEGRLDLNDSTPSRQR